MYIVLLLLFIAIVFSKVEFVDNKEYKALRDDNIKNFILKEKLFDNLKDMEIEEAKNKISIVQDLRIENSNLQLLIIVIDGKESNIITIKSIQ